jgi:hypothetical protein
MKLSTCQRVIPALIALAFSAGAHAEDSIFSFSGFATLGVGVNNTNEAHQALSGQARGYTKSASAEVDSKFGVQAVAKFSPMFSATAQVLSRQNGKGNFTPELEWGFVKAQISPALSLRLGRMGTPYFMVSDFRNVGFANTWLRPPLDVYGQVVFSRHDGADLSYQTSLGSSTLTVSALVGSSSNVINRTDSDFKSMVGFNSTLEMDGGITLRLGHIQGKLTIKSSGVTGLANTLRATPFASVGNELDAVDKDASFTGMGLSYDEGDWVGSFEFTKRKTASFVSDTTGWYGTLGYRVGKFTPYVTVSDLKVDSSNVNNNIPTATVQLATLKGFVDGILAGQNVAQKSVSLGVRWDGVRNMAFKGQFEQIKPKTRGLFTQTTPAFTGKTVNAYSAAVDFVF